MSKWNAKLDLIRKALHVWVVQYHFIIPKDILKMYVHKFFHENKNISEYDSRFYDPNIAEEYNKWLSYQSYETGERFDDITYIEEKETLDLSAVKTTYVCIKGKAVSFYPQWEDYLHYVRGNDLVYFDHDVQSADGTRHDPVCKPDFAYTTLRGFNYIGNCFIVKTDLLKAFDGGKWNVYQWLLYLSDMNIRIYHVSKILYSDNAVIVNERRTLLNYFRHKDIKAVVKEKGTANEVYYYLPYHPLVSIVIPTKDNCAVLKQCIQSIFERTTYDRYEIVIADNGSTDQETLAYLSALVKENKNVYVVKVDIPFNFARINNLAIRQTIGEYIVYMNNDIAVISEDWLEKMLSYAMQENVGTVGVKLLYPDGTIQHGGVITGKGGACAHRYYRAENKEPGYLNTLLVPNNVSCCTAACLMTSRNRFDEMDGMNEELMGMRDAGNANWKDYTDCVERIAGGDPNLRQKGYTAARYWWSQVVGGNGSGSSNPWGSGTGRNNKGGLPIGAEYGLQQTLMHREFESEADWAQYIMRFNPTKAEYNKLIKMYQEKQQGTGAFAYDWDGMEDQFKLDNPKMDTQTINVMWRQAQDYAISMINKSRRDGTEPTYAEVMGYISESMTKVNMGYIDSGKWWKGNETYEPTKGELAQAGIVSTRHIPNSNQIEVQYSNGVTEITTAEGLRHKLSYSPRVTDDYR